MTQTTQTTERYCEFCKMETEFDHMNNCGECGRLYEQLPESICDDGSIAIQTPLEIAAMNHGFNQILSDSPPELTFDNFLEMFEKGDVLGWGKFEHDDPQTILEHCETAAGAFLRDVQPFVNNHEKLVSALATLVNLHDGLDDGGLGIADTDWQEARELLEKVTA